MRFYELIRKAVILGGMGLFVMLSLGHASAAMVPVERFSVYSIDFASLNDFTNAFTNVTTFQTWQGNAGNVALAYTFKGIPSDAADFVWKGDALGNVAVSNKRYSLGLGLISADITASNGLKGQTLLSYNSQSLLSPGVSNGLYTLEGTFNPKGGVSTGNPFTWKLIIPGDWSSTGNTTGCHQLLSINPLWTIVDNFAFVNGQTIFTAVMNNYSNDGSHDIGMDFKLYGAAVTPVPVPAPVLLFFSGLLGLIGLRKRAGR